MKTVPKPHAGANLNQVCVVTVTYSDRRHLLYKTLEAVQRCSVRHIVVVLNGVPSEARSDIVQRYKTSASYVQFVMCEENLGSAGGFAAGLKHACSLKNVRFAWLLDDDNAPQGDALCHLLKAETELRLTLGKQVSVTSMRPGRQAWEHLLGGKEARLVFLPLGSSMGVDLTTLFLRSVDRMLKRWAIRVAQCNDCPRWPSLPEAMYGGLLLPLDVLDLIGMPKSEFFVYYDDIEFSRRLVKAGVPIFLIPESKIDDLEPSWMSGPVRGRGPGKLFYRPAITRVVYQVRNETYSGVRSAPVRFIPNLLIAVAILTIYAVVGGRWREFLAITNPENSSVGGGRDISHCVGV